MFSYAVKNNLDQSFPLNWTLNTGESLLTNSSLSHSIAGNETVLGFIGHNYSDYGAYSVSFTARASGSLTDEEALTLNVRGVEDDFNRSYPRDPQGHHESRLARHLLERVKDSTYLLDIHTSVSSCGFLVPIIAQLNSETKTLKASFI